MMIINSWNTLEQKTFKESYAICIGENGVMLLFEKLIVELNKYDDCVELLVINKFEKGVIITEPFFNIKLKDIQIFHLTKDRYDSVCKYLIENCIFDMTNIKNLSGHDIMIKLETEIRKQKIEKILNI